MEPLKDSDVPVDHRAAALEEVLRQVHYYHKKPVPHLSLDSLVSDLNTALSSLPRDSAAREPFAYARRYLEESRDMGPHALAHGLRHTNYRGDESRGMGPHALAHGLRHTNYRE